MTALTHRQLEALHLLAEGLTDKEIAGSLGISPETVQSHVKRIRTELGVRTRGQAVARAYDQNLIRRDGSNPIPKIGD